MMQGWYTFTPYEPAWLVTAIDWLVRLRRIVAPPGYEPARWGRL